MVADWIRPPNMNNNPHLITRDANDRKTLQVFASFAIDETLPKYAERAATNRTTGAGILFGASNVWSFGSATRLDVNGESSRPPSLWSRFWSCLRAAHEKRVVARATVPVEQIFEAIIGGGKKLEVLTGRLEANQAAITETRAMGQIALAEQLEANTNVVEMEAVLFAAGHRQYIDEQTLIEFAEKCERGLRLDWMKNFVRLIPHNVRVRKTKMDALNVFDAYVVLSYDPKGQNRALTKAEIEKKKDPILFGLIKGSHRLYHVGSWKDEYCDLTFTDLLDKYGKDALTLT